MNILVINGSPKGKNSITLQTCLYLQKKYPSHNFEIFHAAQKIGKLEKDFSPASDAIAKADIFHRRTNLLTHGIHAQNTQGGQVYVTFHP